MVDRVTHFWENFSEAMPAILEPIPEPFASWLMSGAWSLWMQELQRRWRSRGDWATFEAQAVITRMINIDTWRVGRIVDIGCGFHDSQTETPVFRVWRIWDSVFLEWWTPAPIENELPTWVHTIGRQQFALTSFLHEVEDLRGRLQTDLHQRLGEVHGLGRLSDGQIAALIRQVDESMMPRTTGAGTNWARLEHEVSKVEAFFGLKVEQALLR